MEVKEEQEEDEECREKTRTARMKREVEELRKAAKARKEMETELKKLDKEHATRVKKFADEERRALESHWEKKYTHGAHEVRNMNAAQEDLLTGGRAILCATQTKKDYRTNRKM